MTEPENFLQRWSRRKIDAEQVENPPAGPRESGDPEPQGKAGPQKETAEAAAPDSTLRGNEQTIAIDDSEEPKFDITTLPSIESITAQTDIRGFLQKGVPADLTRAALRRAWTADPAIRDFIEVAENQWDFATGRDIPGFGSLEASPEEIRRMVAQVFGEGSKLQPEAETQPTASVGEAKTPADTGQSEIAGRAEETANTQESEQADTEEKGQLQSPAVTIESAKVIVQRNEVNVAMQHNNGSSEADALPARRPHGRALPQ